MIFILMIANIFQMFQSFASQQLIDNEGVSLVIINNNNNKIYQNLLIWVLNKCLMFQLISKAYWIFFER